MFLFRLCLTLGVPHPDYLIDMLTSKQLADWMAYASIETFGDQRADLRSAIMAKAMVDRWLGKHERPKNVTDYLPHYEKPVQTPEQMHSMMAGVLGQ